MNTVKTKSSIKPSLSITLEIPPDLFPETPQAQIQSFLGDYFFRNPQILIQAFNTSNKNLAIPNSSTLLTAQQREELDALENLVPSKTKHNTTQLLREIRDNA